MLHVVLTTKNKSVYVKTLHTLLGIESICAQVGLPMEITFINEDTHNKIETLKKITKNSDRVVWFDYGISIDRNSIPEIVRKFDGIDCLVFPCVKEGVDWDMFTTKCKQNSAEPANQMALTFDVDVSNKVLNKESDFYEVTKTHSPACWCMDTKRVIKKLKDKKREFTFPRDIQTFFDKCISSNIKMAASVRTRTFNHFTHECVGNIMNMSGLKVTK